MSLLMIRLYALSAFVTDIFFFFLMFRRCANRMKTIRNEMRKNTNETDEFRFLLFVYFRNSRNDIHKFAGFFFCHLIIHRCGNGDWITAKVNEIGTNFGRKTICYRKRSYSSSSISIGYVKCKKDTFSIEIKQFLSYSWIRAAIDALSWSAKTQKFVVSPFSC